MEEKENYHLELITRILANEANYQDRLEFEKWLLASKNNQDLYNEIKSIWNSAGNAKDFDQINPFDELKLIRRKIQESKNQENKIQIIHKNTFFYYLRRIAAVLIIGAGIFSAGIFYQILREGNQEVFQEIKAPKGSKSKIKLTDGTKIWLNAGSLLKYSNQFNKNSREVYLEGEAYFDVTKNPDKPFVVKVSNFNIKALGTAFNVKAYQEEGTIETTLVNGSVDIDRRDSVSNKTIKIGSLKPQQRLTYVKMQDRVILDNLDKKILAQSEKIEETGHIKTKSEKVILSKNIDTEVYTAWKDEKLIFRDESLENLAIKLERWYGVKIKIDEGLRNYHYFGTIQNETINQVLEIIKMTLPIEYTIEHNIIIISKSKLL